MPVVLRSRTPTNSYFHEILTFVGVVLEAPVVLVVAAFAAGIVMAVAVAHERTVLEKLVAVVGTVSPAVAFPFVDPAPSNPT